MAKKRQPPKPRGKFGRVQQVYDGKPYKIKMRPNGTAVEYTVCCHCQLVHLEELRPDLENNVIWARTWQEPKLTEKLRERK